MTPMTRGSADDHPHARREEIAEDGGPVGRIPEEEGTGQAIFISVLAVMVIAAVGTWLTGQLAALMFTGAWPPVTFTEAIHVALRLPGYLADPRYAWPVAVQGELPGTAAFYVAAMTAFSILGFGTSAAVRWGLRRTAVARAVAHARWRGRAGRLDLELEDLATWMRRPGTPLAPED